MLYPCLAGPALRSEECVSRGLLFQGKAIQSATMSSPMAMPIQNDRLIYPSPAAAWAESAAAARRRKDVSRLPLSFASFFPLFSLPRLISGLSPR